MFILAYSPVALQRLLGKPAIDKIRSKTVLLQQVTVFKVSYFPRLTPDDTGMVKLNHEDI